MLQLTILFIGLTVALARHIMTICVAFVGQSSFLALVNILAKEYRRRQGRLIDSRVCFGVIPVPKNLTIGNRANHRLASDESSRTGIRPSPSEPID